MTMTMMTNFVYTESAMFAILIVAIPGLHFDLGFCLLPAARPVLQVPLFAELEFGSSGHCPLLCLHLHRENLANATLESCWPNK